MSVALEGCWAKVQRADMHLSFLHQRIESFVDDFDPYNSLTQPDLKSGEITIYGEVTGEPPIDEWGAIIGDIVHNLRSTLDHLVWQLTLDNGLTPPPVIRGTLWKDIRFPIFTLDPRDRYRRSGKRIPWRYRWPGWSSKKVAGSLWGIRPALRTELQRLQPFNHGKDAPKKPLAILDELWNIDKHRHLHPTLFYVALHDVESKSPKLQFRILEKKSPGPFKGRTEVGRVEAVGGPYTNWIMVQMNVQPIFAFDIAFEQGPPAYGAPVIETLSEIRNNVADILRLFDALSRTPVSNP